MKILPATHFLPVLLLAPFLLTNYACAQEHVQEQVENETETRTKKNERSLGIFILGDQPVETDGLDYSGMHYGLGVNWIKTGRTGLLSRGYDLGYQPISTIEQSVFVQHVSETDDGVTELPGTLKIRNQLVTAHYVLRLSPFKGAFRPFAEGLAGGRASVLQSSLEVDGLPESRWVDGLDVPHFGKTWNYGWGVGVNWELAPHVYFSARYAEIETGALDLIDESTLATDDQGFVSFSTASVTQPTRSFRAGLSFTF
jgi:hypothetical protein